MIGSMVVAFSNTLSVLIVGRTIMGVASGVLQVIAIVILSDLIPIRQRGKYLGFMSAANLFGMSLGPLWGAIISKSIGWRWTAVLNVPILFIASNMVLFFIFIPAPPGSFKKKVVRIDFLGIILAVLAAGVFLAAFDIIGGVQRLPSILSIIFVVIGVVLAIVFIINEKKTKKDPLISYKVLQEHNVWIGFLSAIATGVVIYATLFTLPSFYRVITRNPDLAAEAKIWPWTVGVVISTVVCGISMTVYGNYKPYLVIGGIMMICGLTWLSLVNPGSNLIHSYLGSFLIGLGIGFRVPSVTIEAQCVVKYQDLASTTALINFARNVGGVIGMTSANQMLKYRFMDKVSTLAKENPEWESQLLLVSEGIISALWQVEDEEVKEKTLEAFAKTVNFIFYYCIFFSCIGFVLSLVTKKVKLLDEFDSDESHAPDLEQSKDEESVVGDEVKNKSETVEPNTVLDSTKGSSPTETIVVSPTKLAKHETVTES
ncbi:hypothetical protein BB560_004255 [Smittium megazygosporum]|nr:hypothetical protein BB560_004255 [Smittium megazygosporum]